jgi:hypothetical protein
VRVLILAHNALTLEKLTGRMLRLTLLFLFVGNAISGYGQFRNQKLDERTQGSLACEPSIAINPKNPLNIVAASALDNVYVTTDGGMTWEKKKITSPLGVYGDPVMVADTKGTFYYFHLSHPSEKDSESEESVKHIVCHVSSDGGKTWDGGNSIGYNPPKDQHKPWATTDGKGNVYVTWTQFDTYGSKDSTCQSLILLSTSSNGKKWSKPIVISQIPGNCLDGDDTAEAAVPAVGEDKKMYVGWSNKNLLFFDRSFDGGGMWLSNDIVIGRQQGGWDISVPGHDRCNGMPVVAIEKLKGPRQGMLYMTWADQRNGKDDTDVWFIRSANFGDNWTAPGKINDDGKGKHQYLPWLTIDQSTGYIYILYYDRRNYEDNQTDVYLAYSTDAGTSFTNVKISETPFVPDDTSFFGDYLNIAAEKGIITPIWTRMDNGVTSIMTTIIKQADLVKQDLSSKSAQKKKKK